MNRRTFVAGTAVVALGAFAVGAMFYQPVSDNLSPPLPSDANSAPLVRPHAPMLGPDDAPVTIVEFLTLPAKRAGHFIPSSRKSCRRILTRCA